MNDMTPTEVIEEMRVISTEPLSESVVRWADALEQAMREPASKIDALGYVMNYTHLSPGTQLYTLPPNAVGIINEQQREIEMLREALRIAKIAIAQYTPTNTKLERNVLPAIEAALAGKRAL
jgi:hypothetical protein